MKNLGGKNLKKGKKEKVNYILTQEYNIEEIENIKELFNKKLFNLIMLIEKNSFKSSNE